MHSSWTTRLVATAAGGAALALTLAAAAAAAPAATATAVPAAHQAAITEDPFTLAAVSADSATDAWAVGNSSKVLHWNGTTWTEVTTVKSSAYPNLDGVDALSPSDAWAIGSYQTASDSGKTLMLHWNGTNWARVPTPSPGTGLHAQNELISLSMDSATDGWAIGYYYNASNVYTTMLLHWNGTAWARVAGPDLSDLRPVFSLSPTDAWVVGVAEPSAGVYTLASSNWNGTTWSRPTTIPIPAAAMGAGVSGLSGDSPTDLWAVGDYSTNGISNKAWAMHWNGTSWTRAATPVPGESSVLTGVTVLSPADAYAVGTYNNGTHFQQAMVLRWNGTKWARVTIPQPGVRSSLNGVAAAGPGDVWAVGAYNLSRTPRKTLILNGNGTSWTQS
jgi:hypothetical protein